MAMHVGLLADISQGTGGGPLAQDPSIETFNAQQRLSGSLFESRRGGLFIHPGEIATGGL